jgi:hypothetical protein
MDWSAQQSSQPLASKKCSCIASHSIALHRSRCGSFSVLQWPWQSTTTTPTLYYLIECRAFGAAWLLVGEALNISANLHTDSGSKDCKQQPAWSNSSVIDSANMCGLFVILFFFISSSDKL